MRQNCAWCLAEIHSPDDLEARDGEVSHGICSRCLDNLEFQRGVTLSRFVGALPHPVLLAAPDDQTRIFECPSARLPGGCQRNVPCSGCAIRLAVTRAFETGEPQVRLPAALKPDDPDSPAFPALRVSTSKIGPIVFLRLEPAG